MPRPASTKPSSPIPRETLIAHLVDIDLGIRTLAQVASILKIQEDDLIAHVEADPTLADEVAAAVAALKADPEIAVRRSVEGLNAVADALARRVATESENMTTSELSQAGALLDKISALSAQRVVEAKAKAKPDDDPASTMPVGCWDDRPRPDGRSAVMVLYLPPDHAASREAHAITFDREMTDEKRKAERHAWLDRWFPLDASGRVHDIAYKIGRGGWWMTPDGRKHSGVPA